MCHSSWDRGTVMDNNTQCTIIHYVPFVRILYALIHLKNARTINCKLIQVTSVPQNTVGKTRSTNPCHRIIRLEMQSDAR